MSRRLLPFVTLLCLLAPAVHARAGEGPLRFEGARVLASPDVPAAFLGHLPRDLRPAPLTWPLPPGPLLVIGLPGTDDAARAVGEAFGLLPDAGDLGGGWVACAWRDGRRPLGVILAADPVALLDARFELETRRAARATTPEALVTHESDAHVSLLMQPGCRRHRPRYARRILHADAGLPVKDAVWAALGGHATDVLFEEGHRDAPGFADALVRLPAHGVRVLFDEDLSGFFRWSPLSNSYVDGDAARRVEREVGRPILFVETWNEAWPGGLATPRVPSAPRGRAPDLGSAVEGVILRQGRGLGQALEHGWAPPDGPPPEPTWRTHLLPLLPRGVRSPRVFLVRSGEALLARAQRTHDAIPWQRAIATHLAVEASRLRPPVLRVPLVPGPVHDDDRLDESAWAFAASTERTLHVGDGTVPIRLLALADGVRLVLGLRVEGRLDSLEVALGEERGFERKIVWIGNSQTPAGPGSRELTWGPVALDGDAYPTRVLHLRLVPRLGSIEGRACQTTLVLVP